MNQIPLLSLMNLRGIGSRTAWTAVTDPEFQADSPSLVRDWLIVQSKNSKRIPVPTNEEMSAAWEEAQENYTWSMRLGISVISARCAEYPHRLRKIPNPPAVLFVKGDLSALNTDTMVAIIGTRSPTDFGIQSCRRISAFLACSGATIVSGLARGCDTTGHLGCLDAGGTTVAVLAHGLDSVHPAENRKLAQQIVEQGGCLVSEYATGTKPSRNFFVERDRIQSGLSDAVIVIETGTTGGTLHTARFCQEQKRLLACVLHTERWKSHEKAQGNQMLIRERNAIALADKSDINSFIQRLHQTRLDNAHCNHWMDDEECTSDRQLTIL